MFSLGNPWILPFPDSWAMCSRKLVLTASVISARQSPGGTITVCLKARVGGVHSAAHRLPKAFIVLFCFVQKLAMNCTHIIVHVFKIKLLVHVKCGFPCM